jgi:hypothetical protein
MTSRLLHLTLFLFVFFIFSLSLCSSLYAGQDFMLFYSNDVLGETEPCG